MSEGRKYSHGPWEVKPEEAHRDYIRIRGTTPGGIYKIANVHAPTLEGNGKWVNGEIEERRANARLVAAAPETFEAMESLVIEWAKSGDIAGAVHRCRQVIEKVEG